MTRLHSVVPADTLILTASDSASSMSAYLHVVEHSRPDIASVVRQHLFRTSSTQSVHQRRPRALEGWRAGADLSDLKHLESAWPLLWEWADERDSQYRPPLHQKVYPFHGRNMEPLHATPTRWLQGDPYGGWSQYADFVRAQALANSSDAASKGQAGSPWLAEAAEWAIHDQLLQHRYTAHLTREGRLTEAELATRRALKHVPGDDQLLEQLVRILIGQKRYQASIELARTIKPSRDSIRANLHGLQAVALANLGEYQKAMAACKTALTLNPQQVEAKVTMPRLRDLLKNRQSAPR